MTMPEHSEGVNSNSWINFLWIVGIACATFGGFISFLFAGLGGPIPGAVVVIICLTIVSGFAGVTFFNLIALWCGAFLNERHSFPFGMCLFGLPGMYVYITLLKSTYNLIENYPNIWLLPPLSFVLLLVLGALVGKLLYRNDIKYDTKSRTWSIIAALMSLLACGVYIYQDVSPNLDISSLVVLMIFLAIPLCLVGGVLGAISAALIAPRKK